MGELARIMKLTSGVTGGCLVVALFVVPGCDDPNQYVPPPPPQVTVAVAARATVTDYLEEVAQTEAVERAEVRARVRGVLQEMRFNPGEEVEAGEVLYLIEPDEYQAVKDSADAALQAAEANLQAAIAAIAVVKAQQLEAVANLTKAETDYRREEELLQKGATSQSSFDRAQTALDSAKAATQRLDANEQAAIAEKTRAEAQISQATAEQHSAELELGYTEVKAPISGQITSTDVKVGNLVVSGDRLATIVKSSPIWANFTIAEDVVLRLAAAVGSDPENQDFSGKAVDLKRSVDEGYPFHGTLDYYDQEGVDQSTGTLGIRAVFDNSDGHIIPGLFVRVRVPVGKFENALLVPESALGRDPAGDYLLVVDSENTVERQSVTVGPKFGEMVVILEGLSENERFVIDGLQRARPGGVVTPELETLELPSEISGSSNEDRSSNDGSASEPEADDVSKADE